LAAADCQSAIQQAASLRYQAERATGKSPEPAGWKACVTGLAAERLRNGGTQIGQTFYNGFTYRAGNRGRIVAE